MLEEDSNFRWNDDLRFRLSKRKGNHSDGFGAAGDTG